MNNIAEAVFDEINAMTWEEKKRLAEDHTWDYQDFIDYPDLVSLAPYVTFLRHPYIHSSELSAFPSLLYLDGVIYLDNGDSLPRGLDNMKLHTTRPVHFPGKVYNIVDNPLTYSPRYE